MICLILRSETVPVHKLESLGTILDVKVMVAVYDESNLADETRGSLLLENSLTII